MSDARLRAAERNHRRDPSDVAARAELVRALVAVGRGQEAVYWCGLRIGDVVRRARDLVGVTDPYALGVAPVGTVGSVTGAWQGMALVCWPRPRAAPQCRDADDWPSSPGTLDLVEPGDGEQVLAPRAESYAP